MEACARSSRDGSCASTPATSRTTPPASICVPDAIVPDGCPWRPLDVERASRPRERGEDEHERADRVRAACLGWRFGADEQARGRPGRGPRRRRPRSRGRCPPGRSQSSSTIQSGTTATSSAATPEGTRCSAQATPPLPPSRSRVPADEPSAPRRCERAAGALTESRPRQQDRAGEDEPRPGHEQRRQRLHRETDGEVRRPPDEVDGREGGRADGLASTKHSRPIPRLHALVQTLRLMYSCSVN